MNSLDYFPWHRYAASWREATLSFLTDHPKHAEITEQFGPCETWLPSEAEVIAIARLPICAHGISPMAGCKKCMMRELREATMRNVYEHLTGKQPSETQVEAFMNMWGPR